MALNTHDLRTLRRTHCTLLLALKNRVSDHVKPGFSGLIDVRVTRVLGFGETGWKPYTVTRAPIAHFRSR